jgi:2-polyprenyl-3-methyl-5-hydroxy-6-metoxy-1,4-benzoquinol methylase
VDQSLASGLGNLPAEEETVKDAATDDRHYREFCEAVGTRAPETQVAHWDRERPWSLYRAVLHELRKVARPDRALLDVGCADAVFTIPWSQLGGGPAVGLDIARSFVERASRAAQQQGVNGLKFMVGDIQDPSLDLGKFDAILMIRVLPHLNHAESAMRNVRRHLRDGGVFLLQAPTPAEEIVLPLGLHLRYVRGLLSGRLKEEQMRTSDDVRYLREHGVVGYRYRHDAYWPSALPKWVEGFGFRRRRFYTMIWSPRAFPAVNYLEMVARRIPGLNMLGSYSLGVFEAARLS